EMLAQKKTTPKVEELVQKQLQLLSCVAKNRTTEPGTVTGCDKLVEDMKYMVSCATAMELQELNTAALPPQDGPCKKVPSNQRGDPNMKCGTDVLLQLIMDPDLADEIAYVSKRGGIPDDAWKGQSFMAAYN
ncbi:CHR12, partial [Symbiodinium pilosum]